MCMTKKLVVGKNEVEQLTYDSRLNRFKIMPVLNKKDHKYSIYSFIENILSLAIQVSNRLYCIWCFDDHNISSPSISLYIYAI